MILLLMWLQGPAAIGHGVVLPVCLLLWQHCPQSIFGCIGLQQEWFGVVSKHQDGSCDAHLFQCFERLHGILCKWHPLWFLVGPLPGKILPRGAVWWHGSLDGPPAVSHQTEKACTSVYVCGGVHSAIAFRFELLGWTPSFETRWAR